MVTVLLCGSEKESDMINVLQATANAVHAATLYITSKSVSLLPPSASQPDLLIIDSSYIHDIHMEKGIVLFKRDVSGFELDLPKNFIAVVESDNDKGIEILMKNGLQTITCGLSQRDTLTFSSMDTDRAVISLQREILSLFGENILPRELPITIKSSFSQYQILVAAAILLLSELPVPADGLIL